MTDIDLLKKSRTILGLTQKQLAAKLNCSIQSVKFYECGRCRVQPEAFRAILEMIIEQAEATAERQGFIEETARRLNEKAKGRPPASQE
jgi:transcriptional regulator with XRE-family HTH domain